MSDLKFSCPECGQKIACDAAYAGRQIPCPHCQKTITIPSAAPQVLEPVGAGMSASATSPAPAPFAPAPKPITQPAPRPVAPKTPTPAPTGEFSRLAIASFLLSLVAFVGAIPGIICGWMAKGRIRQDPTLRGNGMATAGLIISYCFLGTAVIAASMFGLTHFRYKPIQVIRDTPESLAALKPRIVDEVIIGPYGNESSHSVDGVNIMTGPFQQEFWRSAVLGGSFTYEMKVLPDEPLSLNCRYWGGEQAGRTFDIAVDDQIIATQNLEFNAPGHYFDMEYKIPRSLTRGKSKVKVEFQAHPAKAAGGLFGCAILKR